MYQERSPREAKWLLDHFARTDPDVLWMFSPDWEELKFGDEAYEELWGRSLSRLVEHPRDFLEAVHPADRETVTDAMERLSDETPIELECRLRPDGESDERHVWIEGEPVYGEGGEFVAVAGVVRDITDRKRRKQELERANERLEAFTSYLSHDLRNQLQIAMGTLQLARQDRESEHLDTVERALDRMDELTTDVLALGRQDIDAIDREPVALTEIAADCWQSVESENSELVVEDEETLLLAEGYFRNVFENLFRNAVEHNDDPTTVRVGSVHDGTGIYVEDDGFGIAADRRDDVFGLGHSTDGTGLGLTLVEEVVEAHGGTISVIESDHGGARFEITDVVPS
jgi:PAS domain S-box-containing protein